MLPLNKLTNEQKAKLLFELVPSEIPAAISYMMEVADYILSNQQKVIEEWGNPLFHPTMWIRLAKETKDIVAKNGTKLSGNSKTFSEQLFSGYLAMLNVHCLQQFISGEYLGDPKFKQAVNLLF